MLETVFWIIYLLTVFILSLGYRNYLSEFKDTFFGYKIGSVLEQYYIVKQDTNKEHLVRVVPKELDFPIDEMYIFVQPSDWTICGIVIYRILTLEEERSKFRSFIIDDFFKNFSRKKPTDMDNCLVVCGKSLSCMLQEGISSNGLFVESVFIYSPALMTLLNYEVERFQDLFIDQKQMMETPNYIQ